jgi:TonB family protein
MTSSAIFIYALKSIALSGICFGYYTAFLKNTLMHQYNRFYLLASLLLSLFGPFVKFDFLSVSEEQAASISQSMIYLNSIQIQPKVEQIDWNQIGLFIAAGISLILLAYLALGIYKIYQIKRAHPVTSNQGIEIIETNLENAPFSFLNLLFWKQSIELTSEHGQKIFQHELAHIRQKHTYDRLFCQFAASIAWFNPFHWLISKELQNIHEFIADREAIQNGDIQDFAKMLLQAHYGNEFLNPSHSFYYSSLKRRIMLLTTSKNPKFAYLRRVAVLPMAACALILCSIQIHAQAKKIIQKNNVNQTRIVNSNIDTSKVNVGNFNPNIEAEDKAKKEAESSFSLEKTKAIIFVNGEKISAEKLASINPADIQSMNVLKGEHAITKYGKEGEHGAIEIITKTTSHNELVNEQNLDKVASFPGGNDQLIALINKNLSYPADAKANKTEGKVLLSITIDASGKISEIKVLQTPTPSMGTEATRVIKILGDWIPAKQKGQAVKSNIVLPIAFKL